MYNPDLKLIDFKFGRNNIGLANFAAQPTVRFTPDAKIWIDFPYSIIAPNLQIQPVTVIGDDLGIVSPHTIAVKRFSEPPIPYNPVDSDNLSEYIVTKTNERTRHLLKKSQNKTRVRERMTTKILSYDPTSPKINHKKHELNQF